MRIAEPVFFGQCGSKTKSGKLCDKQSGWGTNHVGVGRCKLHGGNTPLAIQSGLTWLAKRECRVMGIPLDIEPHDALLQCISIAAGEVQYASFRIAELDESDEVGAVVSTLYRPKKLAKGAEDEGTQITETRVEMPQLHVWIQVRHQAMDRLVNYSAAAIKCGLEERLVKVAEGQGQMLATTIRDILRELGVDKRPETPAIVAKHLRLLAA